MVRSVRIPPRQTLSNRTIISLAIIIVITGILILSITKLLIFFKPVQNSPTWSTYSNNEAGYVFSYPSDFKFESRAKFDLAIANSIDEVYLSKIDESQKPYIVLPKGPMPPGIINQGPAKVYPDYYISFYVTKGDPYHNMSISSKIPPKNSLYKTGDVAVGGKKGSMYVYTSEDCTSEIVTIVEANDYTYTIDYDARTGTLHTEGKYFALYKKILSTIQFF